MAFELPIDQPFDLERTLRCGQGHRWRKDKNPGWYTSVIGNDLVHIRQLGGANGSIECEHPAGFEAAVDVVRNQFRLDDPISNIYNELCDRDPKMKMLIDCYTGLRVMQVDPWECLVFFILSANRNIKFASDKMETIADKFGGLDVGNSRHRFPMAEDVSSDGGEAKLQEANLGRDKLRYIIGAANTTGEWDWDCLAYPQSRRNDAIDRLRTLAGVRGSSVERAKTAHCVALFGLGHLDALPIDLHIKQAKADLGVRCEAWPHAGYASQFLFMHDYEG